MIICTTMKHDIFMRRRFTIKNELRLLHTTCPSLAVYNFKEGIIQSLFSKIITTIGKEHSKHS